MRSNAFLLVASVLPLASSGMAQQIQDVDVASQPGFGGRSHANGLSADGRYAAFVSEASNLVPADTTNEDVFVRDFLLGTTTRITGDTGVRFLQSPAHISADGNVVGYSSQPLIAQPLQRAAFVFVRSSATTIPVAPGLFEVTLHDLSTDGSFALVTARSANSASSPLEVYRVEVATGSLLLSSRDLSGNPVIDPFLDSTPPRMDGSGARVVFSSIAANIVFNDTNLAPDVFLFDSATSAVTRINLDSAGSQANGSSGGATISDDGNLVCFVSAASNLVLGDANNEADVFVRDLTLESTALVSLTTAQAQYATRCDNAAISPSGRHVAFTNRVLTPAFPFDRQELKLRELETGVTRSIDLGGAPAPYLFIPAELSDDGQRVLAARTEQFGFDSVPVLVDFGPPCSISSYCTSLPNSTGEPAFVGGQGEASLEANSLVLAALGMPNNAMTVLFAGTSAIDPGVPFGQGLLCVGGTLRRLGSQRAVGGVIIAAQNVLGPRYAGVQPGDTRYFQVWYRDAMAPGGGAINTTDALAVTFCW